MAPSGKYTGKSTQRDNKKEKKSLSMEWDLLTRERNTGVARGKWCRGNLELMLGIHSTDEGRKNTVLEALLKKGKYCSETLTDEGEL